MNRTNQTSSSGRDFFTYGNEGLAVNRAEERRAAEQQRYQVKQALHATHQTPWGRRVLGSLMIELGTRMSGEAARIREREATSPLVESSAKMATTH